MEIHDWIKENIGKIENPIIFEIGANTGSDTVKLAAIPGSTVFAFEADRRCIVQIPIFPDNIHYHWAAVSNHNGLSDFILSESEGFTGANAWTYSSSLLPPKNHLTTYNYVQFGETVKVKTIKLDDYFNEEHGEIEKVDLLWMDVQGAEHKVFEGAKEILKKTKYIYTEYSDNEMYEGQKPLAELLEMLETFEIVYNWTEPVTKNVLLKNTAI